MKKLFPLIFIGILGYGAYLFFSGGGSVSGPENKPSLPDAPDVAVPDVNDGAQSAEDGANWLGDQITSWGPQVWRLIILGVITGVVVWAWKDPKRRSILLGVAALALLVMVVAK